MSVLQMKRTTSKAEFVNTANQIYVETINFLTRISARVLRGPRGACCEAGRRSYRPCGKSQQHLSVGRSAPRAPEGPPH